MTEPLGVAHEVELSTATLRYYEAGPADGPVLVFVHGLLVNARLWRKVVPALAVSGLRCISVDWPLGSHDIPAPRADLTPPGLAALIAEFLDGLDLSDVTVIANDTGGALTQLLITSRPERVGRVVLTNCDCFERFFPPLFAPLVALAHIPGALWVLVQLMRPSFSWRLPIAYGWLARRPIDKPTMRAYVRPVQKQRAIRRDTARVLRGVHRKHTEKAAQLLPGFDKPTLLVWATADRVFPLSYGQRLAEVLPRAQLVSVDDSYTFVPEDQPQALIDAVLRFVGQPAAA
jgi:pimeloyl-ACP methyl ester carboxylesterase